MGIRKQHGCQNSRLSHTKTWLKKNIRVRKTLGPKKFRKKFGPDKKAGPENNLFENNLFENNFVTKL